MRLVVPAGEVECSPVRGLCFGIVFLSTEAEEEEESADDCDSRNPSDNSAYNSTNV